MRFLLQDKKIITAAFDVGLYDKFIHLIKSCGESTNLSFIFKTVLNDSCKFFDCGLARIMITNPKIKRLWKESGGYSIIFRY